MKTLRQLLGERLAVLRRSVPLSEAELAEKTKTSRSGIYEIEAGKKNPTIKQYEKLIKGCDVSPETALAGFNTSDVPKNAEDLFWTLKAIATAPNNDDVLQGLRVILGPLADKARTEKSRASPNPAPPNPTLGRVTDSPETGTTGSPPKSKSKK